MHSSRMRTARLLPVSPSMHCSRGVYLVPGGCIWSWGGTWSGGGGVPGPRGVCLVLGGVPGPRGYLVWGVYLCTWSRGVHLVPGGMYLPRGVYLPRYSPPL